MFIALALALLTQADALAGEVIAHPSVTLSASEVRDVYLGELQFAGSLRLVPVDNNAVRSEFLAKVLQTDLSKYSSRWTRKTFREGLAAPSLKGSDAEVIEFVKATPGAIGYVGTSSTAVRVLEKF